MTKANPNGMAYCNAGAAAATYKYTLFLQSQNASKPRKTTNHNKHHWPNWLNPKNPKTTWNLSCQMWYQPMRFERFASSPASLTGPQHWYLACPFETITTLEHALLRSSMHQPAGRTTFFAHQKHQALRCKVIRPKSNVHMDTRNVGICHALAPEASVIIFNHYPSEQRASAVVYAHRTDFKSMKIWKTSANRRGERAYLWQCCKCGHAIS